jgi:hypothetical protein
MNSIPIPRPNRTPCVRKRCPTCDAALAQSRLAVSRIVPMNMVLRMPNRWVIEVAMGDTRNVAVKLREPTNA